MEYMAVILILGCIVISYLYHRQNMKLLRSVSSPYRGTRAERRLVVRMLRKGVHPKATGLTTHMLAIQAIFPMY